MDVLVIGTSDELAKIAGWLADDGHLVRRFETLADCVQKQSIRPVGALVLDHTPTSDDVALADEWLAGQGQTRGRLCFVGDAAVAGWIGLPVPFRRRVVLSTILSSD
ncbi:MAG: hypothetical protein AB8F65_02005 [Woeseiaceae bacterium]